MFGTLTITAGYMLSRLAPGFLWLASLGFVINWAGDSMDGTLARYRHIERPSYGFYVDHITDAVSQVMIFLGLGATYYVDFRVASLTLIAYLLLSVLVYVRTCVVGEFRISYGRLGPTEIRFLAILLNAGMFFFGLRTFPVGLGSLNLLSISPYDLIVAGIALLLLAFFVMTAIQEVIRLAEEGK
jgi:archaetidylinositol phosphate synthase